MWKRRDALIALAIGLLIPAAAVIGAAQGAEKPPKLTTADVSQHLEGANYQKELEVLELEVLAREGALYTG